jgi:hypothetical protein
MSVIGIEGELENNWIFVYNNDGFVANVFTDRKNRITLFGNLDKNSNLMFNNQRILETYNTEDELESAVDAFVNEPGYYKEQAQDPSSEVYIGQSVKYPPIEPDLEED